MKFCCFNPFPWPRLERRPETWPFPNSAYEREAGRALFEECVDQLVYAEACGFDWVGAGEDHMTAYGLTPNPLLVLSAVAQRTERVRLAVLGCPLPLLNPVRVAEECAMLDVMSRGRLVAGFIRGVPQNYAAYNVDPSESRSRFAQADELIRKVWTTEGVFSWESEHYAFPTVSVWPRPYQQPHPPVLYSANSETSALYAAQRRAMIGAIHLYSRDSIEIVGRSIEAYKRRAGEDGWSPGDDRFLVGFQTCIAETDEEARRTLEPALSYQYNVLSGTYNAQKRRLAKDSPGYGFSPVEESPPSLAERLERDMVLCGSPESVCAQIERLRSRLGMGVINLHLQVGNMSAEHVRRSMALFRDLVRPAFPGDEP